jgi:hypothetical protein
MKKQIWIGLISGLIAASAQASSGEYWEFTTTSKSVIAGRPAGMPAVPESTFKDKSCQPSFEDAKKYNTKEYLQKMMNGSPCQISDFKTAGNKTSYKTKCVDENGKTNIETTESTDDRDSSQSSSRSSTVILDGHVMDYTRTTTGKRIGGSCDYEASVKEGERKMKEDEARVKEDKKKWQEEEARNKARKCDTSKFSNGMDWLDRADDFVPGDTCPGKKEALCTAVRRDAVRDLPTYQRLVDFEKYNSGLLASACGIKMEATRVAVCKANKESNSGLLQANCPAEAKEYSERERRKICEGREYTSREDMTKCMSGDGNDDGDRMVDFVPRAKDKTNKNHTAELPAGSTENKAAQAAGSKDTPSKIGSVTTDTVLEGAKKLKGMFGF